MDSLRLTKISHVLDSATAELDEVWSLLRLMTDSKTQGWLLKFVHRPNINPLNTVHFKLLCQ